jgi:hypothetical protein
MSNPTFGGSPLTTNQAFDPSQDKMTPHLRALNLGGMSSPAALAGTNGVNVELVHGDCWQQITGNVTTSITGNSDYTLNGNSTSLITGDAVDTINGNHDYKVLTNLTLFIKGTTTEERHAKHMSTNSSSLTEIFVGPVDRSYQSTTTEDHPETWLQKYQERLHFEPFGWKTSFSDTSVVLSKIDVIGAGLCVRKIGLGVGAEEGELKLEKFRIVNSEEKLHEQMVDTIALQLHLGAMDAGTPFKPNALPRPTPITPFD